MNKIILRRKTIFEDTKTMAKQKNNLNSEVTDFLDVQKHPFRQQ